MQSDLSKEVLTWFGLLTDYKDVRWQKKSSRGDYSVIWI